MRIIRHFSVLVAGALLLLHTMMPHEHHALIGDSNHLCPLHKTTTLSGLFQLAFHMDQGEGHLENFNVEQEFQFVAVPATTCAVLLERPVIVIDTVPLHPTETTESPPSVFLPQLTFRGPPSMA